jgi:hypothetical protein
MAKTAQSISAADLSTLTKAAIKDVKLSAKLVGTSPVMGFIVDPSLSAEAQLALASSVTGALSRQAKSEGISGLKAKPVVVRRPGSIIAGFLTPELSLKIK